MKRLTFAILCALHAASGQAKDVKIPVNKVHDAGDGAPVFYLIAIGVAQYKDPFWPSLKWPVQDAAKVAAAFGTEMPDMRREVIQLTDGEATRATVLAAMKTVRRKARSADIVALYVSAHGTLAETGTGDLAKVVVLNDTTAAEPRETGLVQSDVAAWLDGLAARRRLVVYATCHGGVGKSRLPDDIAAALRTRKGDAGLAALVRVSEGTLILAAAAQGEAAREDDALQGDVYTHYLLEGLRKEDRNHDGMVTALEAHDYAKEKAYARAKGRQRPTVEAKLIGDADVPLRGQKEQAGLPVLQAYDPALTGFEVAVDDGVKGRLPMALPLNDGRSRVTIFAPGAEGKKGKKLAVYEVRAGSGEVVSLADVIAPPPFALSAIVAREVVADPSYARLTGSAARARMEMTFGWVPPWTRELGLQLAFGYRLERQSERAVRPALEVRLTRSANVFYAGILRHLNTDWRVAFRLGAGQENYEVRVAEDSGGEAITRTAKAPIGDLSLAGGYELSRGLALDLRLAAGTGKADFGELGSMDFRHTSYGLELSWGFGGAGKRL